MIQVKSIRLIPVSHIVVQRLGAPATPRRDNTKQITNAGRRAGLCVWGVQSELPNPRRSRERSPRRRDNRDWQLRRENGGACGGRSALGPLCALDRRHSMP